VHFYCDPLNLRNEFEGMNDGTARCRKRADLGAPARNPEPALVL